MSWRIFPTFQLLHDFDIKILFLDLKLNLTEYLVISEVFLDKTI